MEKEKNNKRLIIVLSILVLLLAVLCVLFATGTISLKSNQSNEIQTIENQSDENQTNNGTTKFDYTKISVEEGYTEVALTEQEKTEINKELIKHFNPGSSVEPLIHYGVSSTNKDMLADDCTKLYFVEWYVYHNVNSNFEIEQYMITDKDELGNEMNKIKFSRLVEIAKQIFDDKIFFCNDENLKEDSNGYVWLLELGGGYTPITMKVLSKYKKGDNYYLIIHMYDDAKCMEGSEKCIDAEDNPNTTGEISKYIKLKYSIKDDNKYLISFEYLN